MVVCVCLLKQLEAQVLAEEDDGLSIAAGVLHDTGLELPQLHSASSEGPHNILLTIPSLPYISNTLLFLMKYD